MKIIKESDIENLSNEDVIWLHYCQNLRKIILDEVCSIIENDALKSPVNEKIINSINILMMTALEMIAPFQLTFKDKKELLMDSLKGSIEAHKKVENEKC